MPAKRKRRSPTWQQSLLLLIFGVVVGYPSGTGIGHAMWGTTTPFITLYVIAFFASAVAFLSGFIGFLAIAARAITSPIGSGPTVEVPRPAHAAPAQPSSHAVVQRQALPPSSAAAIALIRLHVTLAAVVALATFTVLRDWGRPPLTSSYGRYFWLNKLLTLLLSQLPYALVFIRTREAADRVGLALAMVAGTGQVLLAVFSGLRYTMARLDPWSWLSASLGLATAVFAIQAWRPFLSRRGDVDVLISIFLGFVAYTWLAQVSLAILYSREQRWISY
jgi:hypothetical protein